MAAQVNAASQPVQKQNLASVQAQSNASQTVPIKLLTQAQIVMKGGNKRDGQVVKIDQKGQKKHKARPLVIAIQQSQSGDQLLIISPEPSQPSK